MYACLLCVLANSHSHGLDVLVVSAWPRSVHSRGSCEHRGCGFPQTVSPMPYTLRVLRRDPGRLSPLMLLRDPEYRLAGHPVEENNTKIV